MIAAGARNQESTGGSGEELYRQHCANCHDAGISRAPSRAALGQISRQGIRLALTSGSMAPQGANLSPAQIDAMSHFLSKLDSSVAVASGTGACPAGGARFAPKPGQPEWNGWGEDAEQHRFQTGAMAQLPATDVPKLELKWAFGFAYATQAYAQPTVVGGRIFVGSAGPRVYSLNARSGCTYWASETDGPVRTAISVGPEGNGWSAFFGDQHGNVYAVDAETGKRLWKVRVDEHPSAQITGAPALVGGKLYVPVSSLEEVAGADAKDECCKFRG